VTTAADLPVFTFQGYNTEEVATAESLATEPGMSGLKGCSTENDVTDCTNYQDPVIGGARTEWLMKRFYRGKLFYVFDSFRQFALPDILAAFNAKYGPPSKIETRKWQSKAGATYDNEVYVWQFKGGTLELSSMGQRVDEGSFEFVSTDNAPPPEPAKVDF